jgi:hypothetical protein
MKNVVNELSVLLVTHTTCFNTWSGRYGFFKSGFSVDQILDRLSIQTLDQVFGPQECKTCWGLNTSSEGNMLSFLMPTQTHIFDNRGNDNDCLSRAHARRSVGH